MWFNEVQKKNFLIIFVITAARQNFHNSIYGEQKKNTQKLFFLLRPRCTLKQQTQQRMNNKIIAKSVLL